MRFAKAFPADSRADAPWSPIANSSFAPYNRAEIKHPPLVELSGELFCREDCQEFLPNTPAIERVDRIACEVTMNQPNELSIADLQRHIRQMYYDKDVARGVEGTFMWLMEEVGELSSALRGNDRENLAEEFADVIAWLATIANVADIDLNAALTAKYGSGCPGCSKLVCECPDSEKP